MKTKAIIVGAIFSCAAQGAMLDLQREIDAAAAKDGAYPACWMFDKKPLPAYGFYVRHADNIVFEDVSIVPRRPDARPEFFMEDCSRSEKTVELGAQSVAD